MLYNTNWAKTHNDVFSLESLITWLEKQPAAGAYDYSSTKNCLLCQYFRACGIVVDGAGADYVRSSFDEADYHHHNFNEIAVSGEWTFGAALNRARLAIAER